MLRPPRDPREAYPIITLVVIIFLIVLFKPLFLDGSLVIKILFLICCIISFISWKIFFGFVRPNRKYRAPSFEFKRVDWVSEKGELVVRYEKWNDMRSPLIIAIHGWQSDSSSSEHRIEPFLQNGFHAILIDLPGHGFSDGMPIWTAIESGERILSMLENQASNWDYSMIESTVLFGHSMGGFVVLRHADRISKSLPSPISRVYLESPMSSFPLVFDQRTSGYRRIARFISQIDLRWAYLRQGPAPEVKWADFEVPGWGVPSMPVRLLQAEEDVALGLHHLNLLRPYAGNDWEIVIDPRLKHFGKGLNRGNAEETYNNWISNEF